jgi:hypothetical protein
MLKYSVIALQLTLTIQKRCRGTFMLILRVTETHQLTPFHNADPTNSNVRGASLICHCVTSGKT